MSGGDKAHPAVKAVIVQHAELSARLVDAMRGDRDDQELFGASFIAGAMFGLECASVDAAMAQRMYALSDAADTGREFLTHQLERLRRELDATGDPDEIAARIEDAAAAKNGAAAASGEGYRVSGMTADAVAAAGKPTPMWCARHWQPYVERLGNGLGASVLVQQRLLDSPRFMDPLRKYGSKPSARLLNNRVRDIGAACCFLGDDACAEILVMAAEMLPADVPEGVTGPELVKLDAAAMQAWQNERRQDAS